MVEHSSDVLGLSWVKGIKSPALMEITIPEQLKLTTARWGERPALYFYEQNIRLSYREFDTQVDYLARGLAELGLQKGDRVGIWSHNRLEWVLTQFATARLGIILVNINPVCRSKELEYILTKANCVAFIISDHSKFTHFLEITTTLIPQLLEDAHTPLNSEQFPELKYVIRMGNEKYGNFLNFSDLQARGENSYYDLDDISLDKDDAINIQFTSGTTGFPKGVVLTHGNILNNANNVTQRMNFTEEDKLCIPVPLHHCFGLVLGVLGCLTKGASMVFPSERFSPRSTLQAITNEKCTALYGVPTMFIFMLDVPSFKKYDLSSLRTGIMAGSPCPIEVMNKVVAKMHLSEITIAYGMTETSPVSFQSEAGDSLEKRVTTVGRIHPHLEVKLVGDDGKVVPLGSIGELWTKGYSVMSKYWDDPARTKEAIQDGWMRTGDLAVLDEEGYCSIVGRLNDMVLRGGENIYPREIENHLHTHQAIQDVQVFGIPDTRMGEVLCAYVIAQPNVKLSVDDIDNFCKGSIAAYKIPQHIRLVNEMPMSITGKPQKFKMRDALCEELRIEQ